MCSLRPMRTLMLASFALVVALSLALVVGTGQAYAQAPANDNFADATLIPALPYFDSVVTAEATTEATDPDCYGNGPTVWYAYTAPGPDLVSLDANTFGSDYDTTLSVWTGVAGALALVSCNDDTNSLQSQVVFEAVPGETYYFMVGAYASGPGGNLQFSLDVAPPPPPALTIELAVDPVGSVTPKTGDAAVHGTVTCSRLAYVDLYGNLQQKAGRALLWGFGFTSIACDGETRFSLPITEANGRFAGGKAHAFVNAFTFDPLTGDYADDFAELDIRLRGGAAAAAAADSPSLFLPLLQE